MEATRNLCAQVPVSLHTKVREEQEKSGLTLSAYITEVLTNYYEKGVEKVVENTRTMAFQMPESLFQRLKVHLTRESERTGKTLSQKEFVLDLIERALDEAEEADGHADVG